MELRHLRYLVAIADAGTFVAASAKLRVAQPALSRQIRDLERELEVELFEAGARKATLTAAGEACVRIARHVIHDAERAVHQARLSDTGLVGRCVIAAAAVPIRSGMVAQLVSRMKLKYPGISVAVKEVFEGRNWDAIESAEADISLGVPPPASIAVLSAETQYMHTVTTALVGPGHPLAGRGKLSLTEFRDEKFVVYRGGAPDALAVVRKLEAEMRRLQFRDPVAEEMSNFESVLAYVGSGRGWTMVPDLMRSSMPHLAAIEVTDFKVLLPTARVWRRADGRPVVQRVLAELRLMQQEQRAGGSHELAQAHKEPERFMSPRLELRHLRSFERVSESGSFGRAAELLSITQPALSRQMRDLEHDVGVALFERGTRGVALTHAGNTLLGDALAVLRMVDQLKSEAQRAQRGASRDCIVAAAPHPFIDRMVSDVMARELPGSTLKLLTASSSSIAEAVVRSECDLGIAYAYPARVPQAPGLMKVPLVDDLMCAALLSASHPLASRDSMSLRELTETMFLFPPRDVFPPVYDVVMHQFELVGAMPGVQAEFEGAMTIWTMTAQGIGWSLGLRSQIESPPPGCVAIPLTDFRLDWGTELIYRKDEARAPILAMIDTIVEIAGQLGRASSVRKRVKAKLTSVKKRIKSRMKAASSRRRSIPKKQ